MHHKTVQGSAKEWAPGYVNAADKLRQNCYATAGTKFTKPGQILIAKPCIRYAALLAHYHKIIDQLT